MDSEQSFRGYWGWKVTIDELSGGNPLIAEYWYKAKWIMLLNELAYRKEKNSIK
jgi:hypothetical protein